MELADRSKSWADGSTPLEENLKPEIEVLDCLPPVARLDARRITMLSVDLNKHEGRDFVEFQIGWQATSNKAKHFFDSLVVCCEAGCGNQILATDVIEYAFCDHKVCFNCSKKMEPEAEFCPHEECRQLREEKEEPAAVLSATSTLNSLSHLNYILLKAVVFYLRHGLIHSLSWGSEKSGEMRMAAIIKSVLSEAELEESGGCGYYFSTKNNPRKSELQPLQMAENSRLWSLTPHDGKLLFLVVTGPGLSLERCF